MLKKIFVLVLMSLILNPYCVSAYCKTKILMSTPSKGLFLQQGKLTLAKGYVFKRKSPQEILVVSKKTGQVTASLVCSCWGPGLCTGSYRGLNPFCFSVQCKNCIMTPVNKS